MKIYFISILFLFFAYSVSGQIEEELLHALRTNNLEEFNANFKDSYFTETLGKDSLQALAYAAFFNSNDILEWLLDNGAEINSFSGGLTPIMWAARSGNTEAIRSLIDYRAGVNLTDNEGNTALIYASAGGCLECVKLLVNSGADIRLKNSYGYDAEFYAMRTQNNPIRIFLRYQMIQSELKGKALTDGPHFKWIDENKVRMIYFLARENKDKVRILSKTRKLPGLPFSIEGIASDTNSYVLQKNYHPEKAIYHDNGKIFVVGDVHGNFDHTLFLLKNAGVIKKDLSWNWGNGHLVFIGDIFDRGEKVTELLWFIHSLQYQAREKNGNVHLLLGNHEVMNLFNDNRYISDKYLYLSIKTGMEYSETFSNSYELGKWLRSLNTMIKINDILFVHAGISPEMVEKKYSIDEVNEGIRNFISSDSYPIDDTLGIFLSGESGPLWFRGYVGLDSNRNHELNTNFEKSLELYNVNRIVVGHTPAQTFRLDFNNRLIYIDVSSADGNKDEKALLIKEGNYFKVFSDGRLKPLFD